MDRLPPNRCCALALVVLLASGCSADRIPGVYRVDIQQGNVLDSEMLAQLEPGMSRRKVIFLLGTPMLADPFNQDRWDYIYSMQRGSGPRMQRRVSLLFEGDSLVRIEGDVKPGTGLDRRQVTVDNVVVVPDERPSEGLLSGLVPDFMNPDRPARRHPVAGAEDQAGEGADKGQEKEGFLASITPDFLKRDGKQPETKTPEATGEADRSQEVTAAPLVDEATREQDSAYLRELFQGFGRGPAGPPTGYTPDAPATAGAAQETPVASGGEAQGDEEGGFFRGLVDRFRRSRDEKQEATAPPPPAPSPPVEPAGQQ